MNVFNNYKAYLLGGFCVCFISNAMEQRALEVPLLFEHEQATLEDDTEFLDTTFQKMIQNMQHVADEPFRNDFALATTDSVELVGPLFKAVLQSDSCTVRDCLLRGASLQERDRQGRTIFHHVAFQGKAAQETISAIVYTPRKYVIDSVKTMYEFGNIHVFAMRWHIAGLVRALLMVDNHGYTPLEYVCDESLRRYFYAEVGHFRACFGKDILFKYVTLQTDEKK